MSYSLVNVLPEEYRHLLRREYLLRVAIVGVGAATVVLIVNGVLLIPSYLYASREVRAYDVAIKQVTLSGATDEEKQMNAELQTLSQQASVLSGLSSIPTASASIRAILAVSRPNVTIETFNYTAANKGKPGTMQISGTANTRQALQSYDTALQGLSFVSSVDLPISDYAKETNIPFTMTLTGTFLSR